MMPKIEFRCPPKLLVEIRKRAAATGMTAGEWARHVLMEKTGVEIEVKMGLGGADERTRQRVEKARLKGMKKRKKKG